MKKKTYTKPKRLKHKKKKVKLTVLQFYKVDDSGKVQRLRKECPNTECGVGTFMANHFDRHYCGKCGFTENMSVRENPENPQDLDQETPTNSGDRIILINPFTQGMVVIEGTSSLDSLLRNVLATKDGQPPASKASMEAMPSFKIDREMGGGGECVICLEEYEDGEMAKEMPCNHRFHDKCIDKWLEIHGSCPVCRYKMPVDEEETDNKIRDHEHEQRREIWALCMQRH
ncbi:hypothetical protein QYF36_018692 [Acer negundo]|nr:hypothetical protein QYF36_018692 [Acer negundo]